MWTPRNIPIGGAAYSNAGGSNQRPAATRDNLPDAFGALKFLAAHPAVDPKRIGVMGFSWGGIVSLQAAWLPLPPAIELGLRFVAHSAHYMTCTAFDSARGQSALAGATWGGTPIQLHAAGMDNYDDDDGGMYCKKLVADIAREKGQKIQLTIYPKAGHGWDIKVPAPVFTQDRGKTIRIAFDPEVTAEARRSTIEFFKSVFDLQ